jgi:drug/metabolite transporter (DMT)-like permease
VNKAENTKPHTFYPVSIAVISAILFGAAVPASKALLWSIGPFHLAGLLYLGAAIAACPFAFKKTGRLFPWQTGRRNRLLLLGAIIFGGILAPVFLLLGLKLASAASVSMWLPLELVATAVLGIILFRDQLGRFGWLGLLGVVIAGLLLGIADGNAGQ